MFARRPSHDITQTTAGFIAVLVLTAGSAVAANDDPFTEEIARREGFSCGGDFVTMGHTKGGSFEPGIIITTRRTRVIEVWTWDEGASALPAFPR